MSTESDKLKKQIEDLQDLQKKLNAATSISEQNDLLREQNALLAEAQKYYKEHKNEINSADASLKGQLDSIEKVNGGLQSMLLVNKGIVGTFKEMTTDTAKFARSTKEWFNRGEKLAEQYLKVSKNLGVSETRSKTIADNFNGAVRESLLLGTSIGELQGMMSTFADESGRTRILGDDELVNLSKIKEGTGMYESEVASMAEKFDLMGISSQKMVDVLNSAIGSSREMGINSNKVINTLSKNMKTMQQYSFSSGVKGMVEMSKLAVKMRMDVGSMLGMADQFYEPEKAIEAAANLQMLGGDIAEAFGDPFETMYLARNKPEELAKKVGQMTENMVTFNEETGEFDMPAEARMQLQAVSKELGIGMDSLTEMTRQASKIKSIKMNVSGNILDEDMREGIAGMARMKDGKWQVDFTEGGETFTKSIDELTAEQAKLVMDQSEEKKGKTEKDYLSEIALYTQTFSEKMSNTKDSQQYGFAGEMDVYATTMDAFLKETIDTYNVESTKMMKSLADSFGEDGLRGELRKAFVGDSGEGMIEEEIRTVFSNMTNQINKSAASGIMDLGKLNANAKDVNIFTGKIFKSDDLKINGGSDTIVTGPKGTFQLNQEDSYYGKDGDFVAGTDLLGGNIKNNTVGGSSNVGVFGEIKVTGPAGAIASINASELKKMIINQINQTERNGGTTSGKQMVDNGSLNA